MSNLYEFEGLDWDEYTYYRPAYPRKVYELIYDFHKQAGGGWQTAHDVATGHGIVAEELVNRFEKVYASDSSDKYLSAAKERSQKRLPTEQQSKLSLHLSKAETMDFLGDDSVDLVTIATAIHWTRKDDFLAAAHRVLKPGGTLAIITYGALPYSVRPEIDPYIKALYQIFVEDRAASVMNPEGANSDRFWAAQISLDSGMDSTELDEAKWRPGAVRMWWNSQHDLCGWVHGSRMTAPIDNSQPYRSALKPQDKPTQHIKDDYFMWKEGNGAWLDGWLSKSLVPDLPETQSYSDALQKFASAVGGLDAKLTYHFPFALLLATKR